MRRLRLPIQDPCHENWDAMNRAGDGRRFCEMCTKHVHDLSAMSERKARGVLAEQSAKGRVCVRYKADGDGNIKFLPDLAPAPSVWRMTLAAAGMTLAMLTGCADTEPDQVQDDRCVYEVGPWSFTAARGQGSCPAVDEVPEQELVGMISIEPEPEIVDPEPIHEVKGDIGRPDPMPVMGEAPMIDPPPPEPKHQVMGKIAPVEIEPVEIEMMGDVAVAEEPCEPTADADRADGARRL